MVTEVHALEELTRNSMKQIRHFLAGNPTNPLNEGTLLDRLRDEARFLHHGMGLDVILESDPSELELPPETEREIYYVLREALTNVTRHSHASKVQIQIAQKNGALSGTMIDNGVGFSRRSENGFGLAGMEQRIKKIGGELLVKSSPGKGTKVSFNVPLSSEQTLLSQS